MGTDLFQKSPNNPLDHFAIPVAFVVTAYVPISRVVQCRSSQRLKCVPLRDGHLCQCACRPFRYFCRPRQFMETSCNPRNLVNLGLDTAYSRGRQTSTLARMPTGCSPGHSLLWYAIPLTGTIDPLKDHVTLAYCQELLLADLPSTALPRI